MGGFASPGSTLLSSTPNKQEYDRGGGPKLGRAGLGPRPAAKAGSGEKVSTRHFLLGQEDCRRESRICAGRAAKALIA